MVNSFQWYGYKRPDSDGNDRNLLKNMAVLIIGLLIASLVLYMEKPVFASVIALVSIIFFLLALFGKGIHGKISKFLEKVGIAIGRFISDALLLFVFIAAFVPARIFILVSGKDPLRLKKIPNISSYWVPRRFEDVRKSHAQLPFYAEDNLERSGLPFFRKLALLLLLVCLLGGVAEIVLRLYGYGHPVLYVSHPTIGYFIAPNQETTGRPGVRISINGFGMRSDKIPKDKPAGVKRVMIIGDSLSYGGSYIDQNDIYPHLLQENLLKMFRPVTNNRSNIEVLNLSTNAWGPQHQLAYLGEFGTFGTDLAVIALPMGDLNRPLYHLASLPFFEKKNPPHYGVVEVLGHLLWRARGYVVGVEYGDYAEAIAERNIEALKSIAALFESRGGKVAVVMTPYREDVRAGKLNEGQRGLYERLSAVFSVNGRKFYVSNDFFVTQTGQKQLDVYYHDTMHFNKEGHRLFAEYLKTLPLWGDLL